MDIELHSVETGDASKNPFGEQFQEFPWEAQYRSIMRGSSRHLLAVEHEGRLVGGMAVDFTQAPPQLVFFEIAKRDRRRGIGREALLALVRMLLARGETELFIQTGRPVIYRRMGFRFVTVDRSGLLLDLHRPIIERFVASGTPMVVVHDDAFLWHDTYDNPDSPDRLSRTLTYLEAGGLLSRLAVVAPRYASVSELELVHDPTYVERVRHVSEREASLGPDAQTCQETYEIARLGFGGALLAGEYIEDWRRVFVLCRPPGHHATRDQAAGFCFFNNMAGLALSLRWRHYRPFVVDIDAHHGNGTQSLLYEEPIPFVSLHQRDLYPWSGVPQERGRGAGLGYNYNIPLPPLCTDDTYLEAFSQVEDLVDRHRPDVLLVSAGLDGHRKDRLSGMLLTGACYRQIARTLRELAERFTDGRIILLLEGGYNLQHLGRLIGILIQEVAGL